jgi:DNA-binding transcriptional LysR family regulator
MQLHQLEYLVAVADEGSITAAATRLRIAQPGVSAQIRKLEHELGTTLLDRSGHHVELTTAGTEITAAARRALHAVADVRHIADELTGLLRGHVRLGAVTSGPFLDLPEVLAEFRTAHPGVEITLTAGSSTALLAQLRTGRVDLAVAGITGDDPGDLHVHPITEERLVAAVAPEHPLASRASIELAELATYHLIAPAQGNALRDALDHALTAIEASSRITFEASDPGIVARMVAHGLGLAMLPNSLQAFRHGELTAIPLTGPVPRARLALTWRREHPPSPATRALTQSMIAAISHANKPHDLDRHPAKM